MEIVVPVHDEAAGLGASVRRLHEYLGERFPLPWLVTIADNASADQTWGISCRLAHELNGLRSSPNGHKRDSTPTPVSFRGSNRVYIPRPRPLGGQYQR